MREQLSKALLIIKNPQIEIELLKNGRKSSTSSTPSFQDYTRSNRFNARKKSNRKSGGQKGHEDSSLKMHENPGVGKGYQECKVKMKISNQFKSFNFANHYAVIGSVIYTANKNSRNVFDTLSCSTNQKLIVAEY